MSRLALHLILPLALASTALAAGSVAQAPSLSPQWQSSVEPGGTRYLTYSAPVTLLGKPSAVKVIFYCNPLRSKNENGALGVDIQIAKVASLASFSFDDFEGPDAAVPGQAMKVTITRAGQPEMAFRIAPNGSRPNEDDFTFGFAEMSHVPVSEPKTILKALGAGAETFRVVITDPRKPTLKLDVTVPVLGKQAAFQALLVGVAALPQAGAQDETAAMRQTVAEINEALKLKGATKARFVAQRPDVEYKSDVNAWSDATGVRKVEVTDHDDSGDVVTEYYYTGEALVFVYQAIKGFNDAGRQVTRNEERQYFRDGRMVKWRSGMADKSENSASSPEFAEEATTRLAAAQFYLKAARRPTARE